MTTTPVQNLTGERADILQKLQQHRYFLRYTVQNITGEQARTRATVSELTLGGLIKHVALTERSWIDFALGTPQAVDSDPEEWADGHRLRDDETLESWLAEYEKVAARTDELVATLDLDESHPLPEAPWFPPGAAWSNRLVLLHVIAETAQHAGHADIIRETLDGQKTMG